MTPEQFRVAAFSRGVLHRLQFSVGPQKLPILFLRGARPGKTLAMTAAIHGDEYEGVRAIIETIQAMDPSRISGDLLAVPVAHPAAYSAGLRTSPLDGLNLARVFPGNLSGRPTEQIAAVLAEFIIGCADFYLDLHSGGLQYAMPTMVGYDRKDHRSMAAARAFGAEIIWGHAEVSPGRSISYAHSRQIPWIYTEARGAGRIDLEDLRVMKQGIVNLMRHLGMASGEPVTAPIRHMLTGEGDTDRGIAAGCEGFLLNNIGLLCKVEQGQLLGVAVDVFGNPLEEYRATRTGVIALIHELPVVRPGDTVYLIADAE